VLKSENTIPSDVIPARPGRITAPESTMAEAAPHDYLVEVDGDMILPTGLCGGPWDVGAQHGSAVAAVLARAVESVDTLVAMRPARFTVDLLSRVPLTPMRQEVEVVKMGKQIAVVDARLLTDDRVLARASSLLIRDGTELVFPDDAKVPPEPPMPPTEELPQSFGDGFSFPGFWRAMDYVRTRGEMAGGAPASAWLKLRCRVAAGEDPTPFQRLAVAADMGSGIAGFLPFERFRTINADISLHVLRLPESEWIGLDGVTRVETDGIGQSSATMFDERGMVARMQSSIHASEGRPAVGR